MTSSRTAERLARILAMVPWVIAHPGATVDEVSRRFQYTRSDLIADLNLVFVCGLPGYGPGDLMDAYIDGDEVVIAMADYFSRPVTLSAVEALMLLAGGMAVLAAGDPDPALQRAVDKLVAVVLPDPGVIEVDLGGEPEALGMLRNAAAVGEVVHLDYVGIGSGAATERSIEPWGVFAALGNWYVTGHCRLAGGERVFRVDRIRSARTTGERFSPRRDLATPGVRYTAGPDDLVVRIALAPEAAWVADYYPVDVVSTTEAGTVVEFSAAEPAVVARLLLRLGAAARLLPDRDAAAVREHVTALRGRIIARYR
ncbi:MAG TPA: WYL domain-containing protein [Acidimicrobiia bacterium]|nr:WYL domain-containing protein [Acidimicrobiia bacterium]